VFREQVEETTALSANAVVRLKERWGEEYGAWHRRPLWEHQYAYIWADGIYLGAGMEKEKMALLCVLGARRMERRNSWLWGLATERAPRVGPRCSGI